MGTKSGVRTGDTEDYGAAPYAKISNRDGPTRIIVVLAKDGEKI